MTASVADFGSTAINAFIRACGAALLAIGAALALMFAFVAAAIVGVLVAGAALAMRMMPKRPAPAGGPETLEARRTPFGWEVESPRRKG